jgi:hypothetical protein
MSAGGARTRTCRVATLQATPQKVHSVLTQRDFLEPNGSAASVPSELRDLRPVKSAMTGSKLSRTGTSNPCVPLSANPFTAVV